MQLEQFRQIVERARDVIVVTQADPLDEPGPRIVYVNPAFTRLTGYQPEEALGRSPRFLQRPASADPQTLHAIRQGLNSGGGFHGPILNFAKDGTSYWLDMHIFALRDRLDRITHFAAIERDVTARTLRELELHCAANTDPLTGLFNRRALNHLVAPAQQPLDHDAVLLLDLDRFKAVNDRAGHGVGDEVLRALSDVLLKVARERDYPVRLGGDEFALVRLRSTVVDATLLATRIQEELEYALAARGLPLCTVSIGVAGGTRPVLSLIAEADHALREAKATGRNRVISA